VSPDESGQRCAACARHAEEVMVLRAAAEQLRRRLWVDNTVSAIAFFVCGAAFVLWILGRLAVAIGGAL